MAVAKLKGLTINNDIVDPMNTRANVFSNPEDMGCNISAKRVIVTTECSPKKDRAQKESINNNKNTKSGIE